MADLFSNQTSLSPSSSTPPSVLLFSAPTNSTKLSTGLTQSRHLDPAYSMSNIPDSTVSAPFAADPSSSSSSSSFSVVPPRSVERSSSSHIQNGHSNELHHRMSSESLSPAPASSYTGSPNRKHDDDEDDKLFHRATSTNGNSNASSSSKPSARRRRPEPTFITSRDYAPLPAETQLDPHSEAWNTNKRSEISRHKGKVRTNSLLSFLYLFSCSFWKLQPCGINVSQESGSILFTNHSLVLSILFPSFP